MSLSWLSGDVIVVRYADDRVMGFQHQIIEPFKVSGLDDLSNLARPLCSEKNKKVAEKHGRRSLFHPCYGQLPASTLALADRREIGQLNPSSRMSLRVGSSE